ncbi:hypothetical protein ACJIZ3_023986 [Penstemon smallii]|uniref:START domain-containing protein n=1 Tax=Penstemon smallii TaxID=265156 RepID=A0ABD3TSW7_9LAMI
MEGKGTISDYRGKLDKTLTTPDLTNYENLRTLVKNQILQSSHLQLEECTENLVERRSKEVSNFLSMLRSASENDFERSKSNEESHGGWKVKQDTEEFRVMYREGPEGTPYHSLLVEGYVDGPVDICLCISYESNLYNRWWPQTAIPTFKVVASQCLQRIRPGEQISLVRMKVSWPLSSREALIHYFTFEYFQDGLVVVLLNSISDLETIDKSSHGFTRDGIPDAEDVVRIDVVGGFAIQKVTADRSYFRTIANMDIKLDFVPPAFINFISRQLVGSGFKLYKKEVASVSKGDDRFGEALKNQMYARIREALYSENLSTSSPKLETTPVILKENEIKALEDNEDKDIITSDDYSVASEVGVVNEIEELEKRGTDRNQSKQVLNLEITENFGSEVKKKVFIRPEVEQALSTLEKVISIWKYNINSEKVQFDINKGTSTIIEKDSVDESVSSQADRVTKENGNFAESSKNSSTELTSQEPRNSSESRGFRHVASNTYTREINQNKIAPEEDLSSPSVVLHSSEKITEKYPSSEDVMTKEKRKKSRYCCLYFISKHY